jgi:DNA repair exonuclease SbcCD nuclease subunit
MAKYLFTADLHLEDRPEAEYRWKVFDSLLTIVEEEKIDVVFILGDLTEKKDEHRGSFSNRIYQTLLCLARKTQVVVLKGNHDYADQRYPYFGFMEHFEELGVDFFGDAGELMVGKDAFLLFPHSKRPATLIPDGGEYDFILLHNAVKGCILSNGHKLKKGDGDSAFSKIRKETKIISGDAHVPQKVGRILYCGAPHPVNFGDEFEPRFLIWDGKKIRSLPHLTIRKLTFSVRSIEELEEKELFPGDQVRVTFLMRREELSEWSEIRKHALEVLENKKVLVRSISMRERAPKRRRLKESRQEAFPSDKGDIFELFCKTQGITDEFCLRIGKSLLGDQL